MPTKVAGAYKCVFCGFEVNNITVLPISKTCDMALKDTHLLTIGMATYKDFEGVWATIQSLQMYHDLTDCELLVIDNYGCDLTKNLCSSTNVRYIRNTDVTGTAAPRDLLFKEATGQFVLCMDSHVLLEFGSLDLLKEFLKDNPTTDDLYHGPLLHDDLASLSTGFVDEWRGEMWGIWTTDARVEKEEPFEIWGSGMGLFLARRDSWLGFNKKFRGFGGEEGYTQEKYRKAGRKVMLLPWLIWHHRFGRTYGVEYPLASTDKLRNYLVGLRELGLAPDRCIEHFKQSIDHKVVDRIVAMVFNPNSQHVSVTTKKGKNIKIPIRMQRPQ